MLHESTKPNRAQVGDEIFCFSKLNGKSVFGEVIASAGDMHAVVLMDGHTTMVPDKQITHVNGKEVSHA